MNSTIYTDDFSSPYSPLPENGGWKGLDYQSSPNVSSEKYDEIHSDLRDIKEIVKDTRTMLLSQGDRLDTINNTVEETAVMTDSSNKTVGDMLKSMKKTSVLTSGLAGMLLATPIGLGIGLTGLPLGILCSSGAMLDMGISRN